MKWSVRPLLWAFCVLSTEQGMAQDPSVVFEESFDTVYAPLLPSAWVSTDNRLSGSSDFSTTGSSPFSPPNAVLASNATVEQWLVSPPVVLAGSSVFHLRFMVRRSSTFGARLAVEASTDGGVSFVHPIGDAEQSGSGTGYAQIDLQVPPLGADPQQTLFRWHVYPDVTGSSGTLRIDDISIVVERPGIPPGSVVVNELMYQPLAGEPEWVELHNCGEHDVDLCNWTLQDASATTVHLLTPRACTLPARGFLVLTQDSAALVTARPGIHESILRTASFPSLNNSGDRILLRDFRGTAIDSVIYDAAWGGGSGRSLERVDVFAPAQDAANWGSCTAGQGATPAQANSIARRDRDLLAGPITLSQATVGSPITVSARIRNAGRLPTTRFRVRLFDDLDRDALAADGEVIATAIQALPISELDSLDILFEWQNPAPGVHILGQEIEWKDDQQPANDRRTDTVTISIPQGSLRINEIMYAPTGGTAEYIEIVNTGSDEVELLGCRISDRRLASGARNVWTLTRTACRLKPDAYSVIAGDTLPNPGAGGKSATITVVSGSGLGLNNDGDEVVLHGPDGCMIDSVAYSDLWHTGTIPYPEGRSLERINALLPGNDPKNWGTCVYPTGGTPGLVNSIAVPLHPRSGSLSCSPSPFSPDGDGWNDFTIIRYALPLRTALIRMRVYDIRGRSIRELCNSTPAGPSGEVVWNGRDHDGRRVRIGIYIVLLEAIDDGGGTLVRMKSPVIVATKL